MGFIYPDNRNRANRVSQLATQIAVLQFDVSQEADNIRKKDERTLEKLDEILNVAGYKTREEFIEAALKSLTPEQRAKYQEMRDKLDKTDDALEIGWNVGWALLGIAELSHLLAPAAIEMVLRLSMLRMSFYTIAIGLGNALKGNVQVGINMIRSASRAIGGVLEGSGLSKNFLTAMRYIENAAEVLTATAVILDGILFIYEAFEGSRQRTALRKAIVELCSRRFDIQKLELSIRACDGFTDVASNVVSLQDTMNGLVAQGLLTREVADAAVAQKTQEAISRVQRDMNEITNDGTWDLLERLDQQSGNAWTDEDPSLNRVLKWIEERSDDAHDAVVDSPNPGRGEISLPDEENRPHELPVMSVDVTVLASGWQARLVV